LIPSQINDAIRNYGQDTNLVLAKQFLEYSRNDLETSRILKDCRKNASAVFHLQQGIEKTAKAMLILDHTSNGLGRLGRKNLLTHNFLELLRKSIRISDYNFYWALVERGPLQVMRMKVEELYTDKGLFRYALEFTSRQIIEAAKEGSSVYKPKSFEEIVQESTDREILFWNDKLRDAAGKDAKKIIQEHFRNEEIFLKIMTSKDVLKYIVRQDRNRISILLSFLTDKLTVDFIDSISTMENPTEGTKKEESNEYTKRLMFWSKSYVPIVFLAFLTGPHVNCSRYPDTDIGLTLHDYDQDSQLGIEQMFDILLQMSVSIESSVSARI
jgi:HEPN domain-containing protein